MKCALLIYTSLSIITKVSGSSAAGTETLVGIVGSDFILLGADSSVSQSISLTASNVDKISTVSDPRCAVQPFQQQTIVAALAGDAADTDRLLGFLQSQATIREYEQSVGCDVEFIQCGDQNSVLPITEAGLSVEAVAHLTRNLVADRLRTANPLRVCLLVAGMMPILMTDVKDSKPFASYQVQKQVLKASAPFLYPAGQPVEIVTPASLPTTALDTGKTLLEPRLFWLDEYGSLQSIRYGAHGFGSNFILSILDQGYRDNMTRQQATDLMRACFNQLRQRYIINSPQPPCIKCIDARGCHEQV